MQVHKLFSPLEEDVICNVGSGGMLIDFAHLIDSTSIAKYQNRYSAATRHFKDCQITTPNRGRLITSCLANPAATDVGSKK